MKRGPISRIAIRSLLSPISILAELLPDDRRLEFKRKQSQLIEGDIRIFRIRE